MHFEKEKARRHLRLSRCRSPCRERSSPAGSPREWLSINAQAPATTWDSHRDMMLRTAFAAAPFYVDEMGVSGKNSRASEMVLWGFSLAGFVARRFGADKLRALARVFVDQRWSFDRACEQVLGMSDEEALPDVEGRSLDEVRSGDLARRRAEDGRREDRREGLPESFSRIPESPPVFRVERRQGLLRSRSSRAGGTARVRKKRLSRT
ncbi:MAG: hypothetical protein MZU95_00475 [Desulfomicrobium escambiense]|nr:hypothetical protein [Desulfomicrobium escambiense]